MGGSGGGQPAPAPVQDNSAMLAFLSQQQAQQAAAQAAALKAQQEAVYNASVQSATTAGQQGAQQAQQQLGLQNQYQQAQDASALQAQNAAYQGQGASAAGGGFDLAAAQKNQMANLGAGAGYLSPTAANLSYAPKTMNPAATTAAAQTPLANSGVTGQNQIGKSATTTLGGY